MRKKMSRAKDRRVFRRTSSSGKRINLAPVAYRGGIRL